MQKRKGLARGARVDAAKLRVGIAVAEFNADITEALLEAARNELTACRVLERNIFIVRVHGSFELPFACQRLIKKHTLDAVIALGCIVKGETKHDEYLAHAVFNALQTISLQHNLPIGLGILTVNSLGQAKKRIEYGAAAARAALL